MKSGVVLLNKPCGVTSFQALGALKKALGHGKVGHTGTLDKFAHGLMVVMVGRLTRLAGRIEAQDKVYEAVFSVGEETDTLDPEGQVVKTGGLVPLSAWESTLPQFLGTILQSPPAYSAIHVDGKRAYERTRAGEVVSLPPRPVTIHDLRILDFDGKTLKVRVHCSKGTYIRSLARDWATAAGTCASVLALCRTAVGPLQLDEAVTPQEFHLESDLRSPWEFFPRWGLGRLLIQTSAIPDFQQGKNLNDDWFDHPPAPREEGASWGVFDQNQTLLGLVERRGGRWTYAFVGS